MKLTTPIIRLAKASDLDRFYPDGDLLTVRGWAFDLNGDVLGVFGLMYTSPVQAFSTISQELKAHPKVIIKAAKMLSEFMAKCDHDIIAIADEDEPTSMRFLAHIGFVRTHERYFKWPTR
jgi:hypothetical protein